MRSDAKPSQLNILSIEILHVIIQSISDNLAKDEYIELTVRYIVFILIASLL